MPTGNSVQNAFSSEFQINTCNSLEAAFILCMVLKHLTSITLPSVPAEFQSLFLFVDCRCRSCVHSWSGPWA
jgi:hypothetical protein